MDGDWGEKVRRDVLAALDLGARVLEMARAWGEIAPDANCRLAAMAIFADYLAVLYAGLSQPQVQPQAMQEHFGRMLDQLMAGIGTKRG